MALSKSLRTPALIGAIVLFMSAVCAGGSLQKDLPVVPFKLDRNRTIIPTRVNGSRPLNLILDTGMGFDGVLLFHQDLAKEIDMTGAIEVRVPGAGSGEASTALMIEQGALTFGDVTVDSQRVIILQSPNTQTFANDGVIGWNFFGHYAVQIDYDRSLITLHDTAGFAVDTPWVSLPITLKGNIPFIDGKVEVVEGEIVPASFYIDLASEEALEMLVRADQKFTMPAKLDSSYLGTGLSGDIYGSRGRSRHLWLGGYMLSDVRTAFAPAEVRSKQKGADGVLGNDCLRRFNVIFDYAHQKLYLKPNGSFGTPFE